MPNEETTYRKLMDTKLDNIIELIGDVDKKVAYTNGKVKKITLALVLLGGIIIGQSFSTPHEIISLLSHTL